MMDITLNDLRKSQAEEKLKHLYDKLSKLGVRIEVMAYLKIYESLAVLLASEKYQYVIDIAEALLSNINAEYCECGRFKFVQ